MTTSGKQISTSTLRITSSSSQPPRRAASAPMTDAGHRADHQGDRGDGHREPAAPHQPGQHVAAEVVGAEPVLGRRPGQPVGQVLGGRVVRRDPGREHQDQQHQREHAPPRS